MMECLNILSNNTYNDIGKERKENGIEITWQGRLLFAHIQYMCMYKKVIMMVVVVVGYTS